MPPGAGKCPPTVLNGDPSSLSNTQYTPVHTNSMVGVLGTLPLNPEHGLGTPNSLGKEGAFQGCYALTQVVAPGCVNFGRRAFAECLLASAVNRRFLWSLLERADACRHPSWGARSGLSERRQSLGWSNWK